VTCVRRSTSLLRWSDARGATLVEYLLVVGVIALTSIAGFTAFGDELRAVLGWESDCVRSFTCTRGTDDGTAAFQTPPTAASGQSDTSSGGSSGTGAPPSSSSSSSSGGSMSSSSEPSDPAETSAAAPAPATSMTLAEVLSRGTLTAPEYGDRLAFVAQVAFTELDDPAHPPTEQRARELETVLDLAASHLAELERSAWRPSSGLTAAEATRIMDQSMNAQGLARRGRDRAFQVVARANGGGTLGSIVSGFFVDGAWGTVTGVWGAVTHPIATYEGVKHAVTHPVATYEAVRDGLAQRWEEDPARLGGAALFEVVSLVVAPAKVARATGLAGDLRGAEALAAAGRATPAPHAPPPHAPTHAPVVDEAAAQAAAARRAEEAAELAAQLARGQEVWQALREIPATSPQALRVREMIDSGQLRVRVIDEGSDQYGTFGPPEPGELPMITIEYVGRTPASQADMLASIVHEGTHVEQWERLGRPSNADFYEYYRSNYHWMETEAEIAGRTFDRTPTEETVQVVKDFVHGSYSHNEDLLPVDPAYWQSVEVYTPGAPHAP